MVAARRPGSPYTIMHLCVCVCGLEILIKNALVHLFVVITFCIQFGFGVNRLVKRYGGLTLHGQLMMYMLISIASTGIRILKVKIKLFIFTYLTNKIQLLFVKIDIVYNWHHKVLKRPFYSFGDKSIHIIIQLRIRCIHCYIEEDT